MRLLTAGESHGPGLTGILEGLPAGLRVDTAFVDAELKRRQSGYGRGGRMQIESDRAVFTAGLRGGLTLGAPLCFSIENRDFESWKDIMGADATDTGARAVTRLRPGHADFAGSVKYGFTDARNVLERASARETAVRVAAGAVCRCLLNMLGITVGSRVLQIGGAIATKGAFTAEELFAMRGTNEFGLANEADIPMFRDEIDRAKAAADTLGGVIEVVIGGVVAGIGTHTAFDRKLSTALFAAIGSVQSVKCVEIGLGRDYAPLPGSLAHDEMTLDNGVVRRSGNNAGGIEGGISNGEPIVLRATVKPIPTVMKGLKTFDFITGEPCTSAPERSDVCAVPAAAVVLESAAAYALTEQILTVTGGDNMQTVVERFAALPGQVYRRRD